jgi:hypothetical protein
MMDRVYLQFISGLDLAAVSMMLVDVDSLDFQRHSTLTRLAYISKLLEPRCSLPPEASEMAILIPEVVEPDG